MTSTKRPGSARTGHGPKGKQAASKRAVAHAGKAADKARVVRKPGQKPQQMRGKSGPAQKPAHATPTRRGGRPAPMGIGSGPIEPMRIAKAIARAGLCSRRDAERWIDAGRVVLNGKLLNTPAIEVGPKDRIVVDGAPLPVQEPVRLWRYHKPRGLVTTHRDPQERSTVFDALPDELPRVISIGRLDYNTEGLLLLTNDGALARHLELPATGWMRRYRVRAFGRVSQAELDALKDGVTIEGVRYASVVATIDSVQGGNMWLTLGLREGKNREVRRILEHLDLKVNRLIRISYGPFQLKELKQGAVELVRRRIIADQLGPEVARGLNLGSDADDDEAAPNAPVRGRGAKAKSAEGAAASARPKRKSTADRSVRRGGDIVDAPKPARPGPKRGKFAAGGAARGEAGQESRPKRSGAGAGAKRVGAGAKRSGPSRTGGPSRSGRPNGGPRGGPRAGSKPRSGR